ncbi:lytic transglycosylase domain-containing protein [uncultured Roseobacter sp.]|uniref:lytic transglycosylase domain-containing protein n=1 Tax=uncultured Roseobacter sp. TaxID=114847 RepID=UPI00261AAD19|nr:lytic transglycosylase domain-containing protein [uncultured Roseobacter sp.]
MTDWIGSGNTAAAAVLSALSAASPADQEEASARLAAPVSTPWAIEEQWHPDALPPIGRRLLDGKHEDVEKLVFAAAEKYRNHDALARLGITQGAFRAWLMALIRQESRFSAKAKSPKDAFGLTQIIPPTAKSLGIYPEYYKSPELQVDGGARYLLDQLETYGSMPLALAAYNAGPNAVKKFGGVPPYKETQRYVAAVVAFYNQYARQLGTIPTVNSLEAYDLRVAEAATRVASLGQIEPEAPPSWEATASAAGSEGPIDLTDRYETWRATGPVPEEIAPHRSVEERLDPFSAGTKVNIQF